MSKENIMALNLKTNKKEPTISLATKFERLLGVKVRLQQSEYEDGPPFRTWLQIFKGTRKRFFGLYEEEIWHTIAVNAENAWWCKDNDYQEQLTEILGEKLYI
jgi:hypothetical protein